MVNAFSFCLYGQTTNKYHRGFLENVDMIRKHFPGWIVYAYLGSDTESGFRSLLVHNPTVRVRDTGIVGPLNMIHRFFAIDEPDVDVCFFRDADSRVHWRDRWAIRKFMSSDYSAHAIRDHPMHTAVLMGGLWGLRKNVVPSIRELYESWIPEHAGSGDPYNVEGVGVDQNFLIRNVYLLVRPTLLVHCSDSNKLKWERAAEFPFKWSLDNYCGKPEDPPFRDSDPPMMLNLPHVFTKLS